jgi:hypothetical protein
MFLTTQELDSVIDLPISMPSTLVRSGDWLVVASFNLLSGQTLLYKDMNLTVLSASIDGVDLALGNQCNQFNIKLLNNSYGISYVGIAKDFSATSDPQSVTWIGSAADVISADSVGTYVRSSSATELEITESGVYSVVLVNNCESTTSTQTTSQLYNVDLKMIVSSQIRLKL